MSTTIDSGQRMGITTARAIKLVAGREMSTRLRSRAFYLSTIVLLVVLGGSVFLQSAIAANSDKLHVGLSGQAAALAAPLSAASKQAGADVSTSQVGVSAGTEQVRGDDLDALVTGSPTALRVIAKESLDDKLRQVLTGLARQQTLNGELARAGLSPAQVQATVAKTTVDVRTLQPADPMRGQRTLVGIVLAILLYISLLLYGNTVTQGVVEEKSSRVVEVLLATLRPWQLLFGKVLGIGVVGLVQIGILAIAGGVLANASGAVTLPSATVTAVVFALVWYILGFLLYAMVFAAAGSLVSRQEDVQQVATPITMVIVIGFVLGISLLGQSPNGTTTTVLSLLPPFAPILMPGRLAVGGVAAWQVIAALVLMLAAIAGVTWLAGKIYNNSVLRTGSRVSLRDALR